MSSETIINRTPETDGQARERRKLESQGEIINAASVAQMAEQIEPLPVPFKAIPGFTPVEATPSVFDTPQGEAVINGIVEQAAVELGLATAKEISVVEPPEINISEEIEKLVERAGWKSSTPLIVSSSEADIKKLRQQTIAAFKELGLDVNKFFGV